MMEVYIVSLTFAIEAATEEEAAEYATQELTSIARNTEPLPWIIESD